MNSNFCVKTNLFGLSPKDRFKELKSNLNNGPEPKTLADKAVNPAYQQIIGMGKEALPFIFKELDSGAELKYWLWALISITGTNPVPKQFRTEDKMACKYWITWAKNYGYLPIEEPEPADQLGEEIGMEKVV